VFFTDAIVPADKLVGSVGDGWKIAMTTLAHERRGADGLSTPSNAGRAKDVSTPKSAQSLKTANQPYKWYPQRAGRVI